MSVASRYPAIKRKDKEEASLQAIITPCCEMQQDIEDNLIPRVTIEEIPHKKDVFVANDWVKATIEKTFHRDGVMHQMVNGDPKTVVDEDLQRISDAFVSTGMTKTYHMKGAVAIIHDNLCEAFYLAYNHCLLKRIFLYH